MELVNSKLKWKSDWSLPTFSISILRTQTVRLFANLELYRVYLEQTLKINFSADLQ
jgi:hypothetical protein